VMNFFDEDAELVSSTPFPARGPYKDRARIRSFVTEYLLVYLPAYSPDYNPIEEAFAKIKNLLRKAAGRAKEALVKAIGAALSEISARDARSFFEHAGYRPTAHLL
jgi:transposase